MINRRNGPACLSLICFFNRGDTEGTNSSKVLCLMFVYVLFLCSSCLATRRNGWWYVQHAAIWHWYLLLCIYITFEFFYCFCPFLFYTFKKSGIDKSTEWFTIPVCPSLMCFFNRGDTEGTNSSKNANLCQNWFCGFWIICSLMTCVLGKKTTTTTKNNNNGDRLNIVFSRDIILFFILLKLFKSWLGSKYQLTN